MYTMIIPSGHPTLIFGWVLVGLLLLLLKIYKVHTLCLCELQNTIYSYVILFDDKFRSDVEGVVFLLHVTVLWEPQNELRMFLLHVTVLWEPQNELRMFLLHVTVLWEPQNELRMFLLHVPVLWEPQNELRIVNPAGTLTYLKPTV